MNKPLLSIGIIFKNEIRSLEHCLKALAPLREALPCQLLMADTGSTDGCRELAEQYADVLIDFPWIDDFSAARNAVIDRADGEWYLVVDDDEYLDEDFSQLITFLEANPPEKIAAAMIVQRNYYTYEMDRSYDDFLTTRLFRMSKGIRYEGAIHEYPNVTADMGVTILRDVVLKHDGYVGLNTEAGKKKRERNLASLRKMLKENPNDLRRLMQYLDVAGYEPDYLKQLYRAVRLVEKKASGWESYGAPLLRLGVAEAQSRKLPELEKWAKEAQKFFPKSYYTRIDVRYTMALDCFIREDYAGCLGWGEPMLEAYAGFRAGKDTLSDEMVSGISKSAPLYEATAHMMLSKCYLEEEEPERALALLETIDGSVLEETETRNLVKMFLELHSRSELDTAPLVRRCWEDINRPVPHQERADQRRAVFLQMAAASFSTAYRESEQKRESYARPAYTALLPLAEECGVGLGAAIMESHDPAEMERLLEKVEKWNEFPATALLRALKKIPAFPLPNKPMRLEEMDDAARRLSGDGEVIRKMALESVEKGAAGNWQCLNWSRALLLASIRSWGWKEGGAAKSMELARGFARLEKALLPRYYSREILLEENTGALPPLHRFGWYLVRAFDALDSGDAAGYARLLRNGLQANEGMKPMVEFLLEHTEELEPAMERNQVSGELSALAQQIRALLANYAPDDPAVRQIKSTPVYQRVAWMLEEPQQE